MKDSERVLDPIEARANPERGVPGMTGAESCPDCGARLPAGSPSGLCPFCLLRLGAALSAELAEEIGSEASSDVRQPAREDRGFRVAGDRVEQGSVALAVSASIHLRDAAEAARLVRPGSPEMPDLSGQSSRYQLIGELARGGMGAIFQGRDLNLGRDLAVKVIREEHCNHPEMVRRFVEEAQIGGQLQHPGITPVHELGRFPDGRLFIAMKLVRGRTLAALLELRGSPDEDRMQLLSVFEQVCQTMAYAHSRGVIHRDLKPSNVMVGTFGEVQVMDWGVAKVLDQGGVADEERALRGNDGGSYVRTLHCESDGLESLTGSVLGTPSYMAPEQARGQLDTLDERADVFALGSILCEILTGQPAFAGALPRRSTATQSEPTWRTRRHACVPVTPMRSWWSWRKRAWPPRRSTARGTAARWSRGCRRTSAGSRGG